jgi:hypothetical protein
MELINYGVTQVTSICMSSLYVSEIKSDIQTYC